MKIETLEIAGLDSAIKGMRLPMMSRGKLDSYVLRESKCDEFMDCLECPLPVDSCHLNQVVVGENDMNLCKRLVKAGSEHHKFTRMIQVWADVDMPRYWWSEADTYKFGVKNSESTMHKLLNNKEPITIDMFVVHPLIEDTIKDVVFRLEELRQMHMGEKEIPEGYSKIDLLVSAKRLLPDGFLQMRTWNTNYAELRNMYHQRKHHRLKEEWQEVFCKWVESLPYSRELIIGEED